jgi:hypothetical protein
MTQLIIFFHKLNLREKNFTIKLQNLLIRKLFSFINEFSVGVQKESMEMEILKLY